MRGNFPARRLPRAWGRFRPLRAFLRRGFPSAREFPCPALAARLGPFPAPPRLSARGFPLRGNLPGACRVCARFSSAREFARRLPRAWGRLRPLRAFLRCGFPLHGDFSPPGACRAPGAVSGPSAPFCAAVSLCAGFFPPGACRAPGVVSGPSAPFCAAVSLCAGIFPAPALAARLGPFPAPPRLSAPRFSSARGFFPARRLPRAWGRFRPLRAFLRAVFLCAGICPALAARLPRAWGRLRPLLSTTLRFLSFRETARVSLLKRSCTQHETCGRTNP